ncbi:MAG: membrane protein insertase YidC [Ilumatobacteraceae bacterium]
MFEVPASLLAWFYSLTSSYALSIALIAVVVMLLVTPLTLKSTKGMLEMQRLAPEMRRLQQEHKGDRQKLNEEMMKLYQEHKVNPMASCLPIVAQTPVFIVMFRIMLGLTYTPTGNNELIARSVLRAGGAASPDEIGFVPRFVSTRSDMFQSLVGETEMLSLGLDLSLSPALALGEDFTRGLIYALLVVLLGSLYFFQQRMVAARASVSPSMSPSQQKLMQYLPVVFAVFQIFFLLGLVIYYIMQAILRILQQGYITRRFYGHEESIGRQAQRAGERARELAEKDGGGGGLFAQAKRDLTRRAGNDDATDEATDEASTGGTSASGSAGSTATGSAPAGGKSGGKSGSKPAGSSADQKKSGGARSAGKSAGQRETPSATKRTTPPKNRPTPTNRAGRNKPNRPGGSGGRTKKR